jgi:hypothetical protein
MTIAEVGESEQCLSARAQATPASTGLLAALAELGGQEAQGRAGDVQPGRVDKHANPLVETVLLGRKPIYQGFIGLSAHLADPAVRLDEAHGRRIRCGTMRDRF